MPTDKKDTRAESIDVPARVLERVKRKPWWGPLLAPVETLVALIPSHKNTKKGRQSATQIRITLIVIGIVGLAFGGETLWIMLGGLIMASGLVVPLSDVRKRTLIAKLKRMRGAAKRDLEVDGQLRFDGKRLVLYVDGEKKRRVLMGDGRHKTHTRRFQGRPCLEVRPGSGGKRSAILICSDAKQSDAIGDELTRGDVDCPAFVSSEDFEHLRDQIKTS